MRLPYYSKNDRNCAGKLKVETSDLNVSLNIDVSIALWSICRSVLSVYFISETNCSTCLTEIESLDPALNIPNTSFSILFFTDAERCSILIGLNVDSGER